MARGMVGGVVGLISIEPLASRPAAEPCDEGHPSDASLAQVWKLLASPQATFNWPREQQRAVASRRGTVGSRFSPAGVRLPFDARLVSTGNVTANLGNLSAELNRALVQTRRKIARLARGLA